jgi:hypothetical protein
MPYSTEQLYRLLPAIYRVRDAERGYPLRGLIAVLAEQAAVMEEDIARLYENWFIETCDEWVVPYIGDLLGARGLHSLSEAGFSQRARVAHTLGHRRRKGTASMLEQLARDTTGWPARVVEYFQLLETTQYANHIRLQNLRTPDLRDANALELLDGPFDTIAHTADVRHIDLARGKHNIMNVGLFLWRLRAFPVLQAPAFAHGSGQFSFNQLGFDAPLFNHPWTETDPAHLADETNVPAPLRRLALEAALSAEDNEERYYGESLSLHIWRDGMPVPRSQIVACNLGGWQHRPHSGSVCVDPVLGRIAFPAGEEPAAVQVTYHYGFAGEVGGGCYARSPLDPAPARVRYAIAKSSPLDSLGKAISRWATDGRPNAVFEIQDNAVYDESISLLIPPAVSVEIRAADQRRPVLRLTDPLRIRGALSAESGHPGGELIIDGLLITGNAVEVLPGDLQQLHVNHCTLVPGWALTPAGDPVAPKQPSLIARGNGRLAVSIARTISGRLMLAEVERMTLTDSIVDGLDDSAIAATKLLVNQSTVFGSVHATVIEQASNSIFRDPVRAERKQEGCVRFCYLPLESQVPRRYRCEPDTAMERERQARAPGSGADAAKNRVRPRFTSTRYGQPGYAQLHMDCAREIQQGADDQAEMGVFHHLKQPQREANLRASLCEYLRLGLEAGLFYVT